MSVVLELKPPWLTEREVVVKSSCDTNPDYGHDPFQRPIEEHVKFGVVNLDKPPGPSSHEVVAWVKRMLSLERAGHGGTLVA